AHMQPAAGLSLGPWADLSLFVDEYQAHRATATDTHGEPPPLTDGYRGVAWHDRVRKFGSRNKVVDGRRCITLTFTERSYNPDSPKFRVSKPAPSATPSIASSPLGDLDDDDSYRKKPKLDAADDDKNPFVDEQDDNTYELEEKCERWVTLYE